MSDDAPAPSRRVVLRRLRDGAAFGCGLFAAAVAHGAAIVAVRVWPARDYTRVTIESDAPLTAGHVLTEAPYRLGIDIQNLELSPALRELVGQVRPDDPFIARVRVGQYAPRVVRLVLDLKQAVRPEQFALEPVAAYRHRLVFDLFPVVEADPLLSLLRERPSAASSAPAAGGDALGELIARMGTPSATGAASSPAASSSSSSTSTSTSTPTPTPSTTVAGALPAPPASGPRPGGPAASRAAPAGDATATAAARPPAPGAEAPAAPAGGVPTAAERQRVNRLVIVALDPGHGGEDPGAVGPTGLLEKDVVLAIAMQLRDRLNALPGLRVMLTRDGDYFVPLQERVRKARRVQADLFVSLHADAFLNPEARGASVFALSRGGASSAAARWMAQRENAADAVGGVNATRLKDPQLLQAILDMSTTAQIKDSLQLGHEVLTRIGEVGRLHKPRVEQAGFAVLKAPDIPSVLVETAFISNPEEEQRLRDPAYRRKLVQAIAAGIQRYFARHPPLARQRTL